MASTSRGKDENKSLGRSVKALFKKFTAKVNIPSINFPKKLRRSFSCKIKRGNEKENRFGLNRSHSFTANTHSKKNKGLEESEPFVQTHESLYPKLPCTDTIAKGSSSALKSIDRNETRCDQLADTASHLVGVQHKPNRPPRPPPPKFYGKSAVLSEDQISGTVPSSAGIVNNDPGGLSSPVKSINPQNETHCDQSTDTDSRLVDESQKLSLKPNKPPRPSLYGKKAVLSEGMRNDDQTGGTTSVVSPTTGIISVPSAASDTTSVLCTASYPTSVRPSTSDTTSVPPSASSTTCVLPVANDTTNGPFAASDTASVSSSASGRTKVLSSATTTTISVPPAASGTTSVPSVASDTTSASAANFTPASVLSADVYHGSALHCIGCPDYGNSCHKTKRFQRCKSMVNLYSDSTNPDELANSNRKLIKERFANGFKRAGRAMLPVLNVAADVTQIVTSIPF